MADGIKNAGKKGYFLMYFFIFLFLFVSLLIYVYRYNLQMTF